MKRLIAMFSSVMIVVLLLSTFQSSLASNSAWIITGVVCNSDTHQILIAGYIPQDKFTSPTGASASIFGVFNGVIGFVAAVDGPNVAGNSTVTYAGKATDWPAGRQVLVVSNNKAVPSSASTTCAPTTPTEFIVYRGKDQHIYVLYQDDTPWRSIDLNATHPSFPLAAGRPTAFISNNGTATARIEIAYLDAKGHVYTVVDTTSGWNGFDETANTPSATNAAPPTGVGMDLAGIETSPGLHYVVYQDTAAHIIDLASASIDNKFYPTGSSGGALTKGLPLDTQLSVYTIKGKNTHLILENHDGNINQIYGTPDLNNNAAPQFTEANLTKLANAPYGLYANGYAIGGGQAVVYNSTDRWPYGHIHQLYISANKWVDADLTQLANAPHAYNVHPVGLVEANGTQSVVYMGDDAHLYQLYTSGNKWLSADLTTLANAPKTASNYFPMQWHYGYSNYLSVAFWATDGHIHVLHKSIDQWIDTDVTTVAGAPNSDTAPIAGYLPGKVVK